MDDSSRSIASGQGAITLSEFKLEKGSAATPWIPNPSDTEYHTMGLDDGIEYDPERERRMMGEEQLGEGDLSDGYTEEGEMETDEDEENEDDDVEENDSFFEALDEEGDEEIFDNDLANDNLDNDDDLI